MTIFQHPHPRFPNLIGEHFPMEAEAKTPHEAEVKMRCFGYDHLNIEELKLSYQAALQSEVEFKAEHPRSTLTPGEFGSLAWNIEHAIKFFVDNPGKSIYAENGYSIDEHKCRHS